MVLGFILQLLWDAAVLWALLGGPAWGMFSEEYRKAIQADPGGIPIRPSPFFYVPIVLFVLNSCLFWSGFSQAFHDAQGQ
jgi:hypothetical protein